MWYAWLPGEIKMAITLNKNVLPIEYELSSEMNDKEYIEYLENKIIELEDKNFELEEEIVALLRNVV